MSRTHRAAQLVARVLLTTGLLTLGYVAYVVIDAKAYQTDEITMTTQRGDFQYLVESTAIVAPTDVEVIEATGGHTLTLITCFPFSYVGPAPDRFIVRAREREGQR